MQSFFKNNARKAGLTTFSLLLLLLSLTTCQPPARPLRQSTPATALAGPSLRLPPNMQATIYAANLPGIAALALAPDETVTAAIHGRSAAEGQIWQIREPQDQNETGRLLLLAEGLIRPNALLWLPDGPDSSRLLVGGQDGLHSLTPPGPLQPLLKTLPDGAPLHVHSLALGPDGLIYLSQGAPLDGRDDAPRPGAVWRVDPAGLFAGQARLELFASGFRNPTGLAISPSGAIYLADTGLGWPERDDAPDEINLLLGGGDYGWPGEWGMARPGSPSLSPVVELNAGLGVSSLIYHRGRLFNEYANDLLLTSFGPDNAARLLRVQIISDAGGYHSLIQPLIKGLGRSLALLETPDGSLLLADYDAGLIYQLSR